MHKFIDHNKYRNHHLEDLYKKALRVESENRIIVVIRPILFFYPTQEITLGKLGEYFTENAITKLMGDDFVKFKDDE